MGRALCKLQASPLRCGRGIHGPGATGVRSRQTPSGKFISLSGRIVGACSL